MDENIIMQKSQHLINQNELLSKRLLNEISIICSGTKSIKTADPTSPIFQEFWELLDKQTNQIKVAVKSVVQIFEQSKLMNYENGEEFRHFCQLLKENFLSLFEQLYEMESICTEGECNQVGRKSDLIILDFSKQKESFMYYQLQYHSVIKEIRMRLEDICKLQLNINVMPRIEFQDADDAAWDYDSDSSKSSCRTLLGLARIHNSQPRQNNRTFIIESSGPSESSTVSNLRQRIDRKSRRTGAIATRKTTTKEAIPRIPSLDDAQLIINFRSNNVANCTLEQSCNCNECYALHLPERSDSEDDSDIDTMGVTFDVNFNTEKSGDKNMKDEDEDDPEIVKQKLQLMKNNEIIRDFEKALNNANNESLSSMFAEMLVWLYKWFIRNCQRIITKKRSTKVSPLDDYKNNNYKPEADIASFNSTEKLAEQKMKEKKDMLKLV